MDLLNDVARNVGAIVTLENHNVQGGFGSAVAEALVNNYPVPVEFIGLQNVYAESAPNDDLLEKYQLSAPWVVAAAKRAIKRKK